MDQVELQERVETLINTQRCFDPKVPLDEFGIEAPTDAIIHIVVCMFDRRRFDVEWLVQQCSRTDLGLNESAIRQILSFAYEDMCAMKVPFVAGKFDSLAIDLSSLGLKSDYDRFAIGDVIENVRIVDRIGVGSMGVVYRGVSLVDGSSIAIKVGKVRVKPSEPDAAPLLRQEFAMINEIIQLSAHESIPFCQLCETPKGPVLFTKFISGIDLEEYAQRGQLDLDESLRIAASIGEILDGFHKWGIIHGDVKPSNVMIDDSGKAHLIDLNIAVHDSPNSLRDGKRSGTIPYMGPESLTGVASDIDLRVDIHSLGALLYLLAYGRPYVEATDREDAFVQSVVSSGLTATDTNKDVTPAVQSIIAYSTDAHIDSRFESAGDFARACHEAIVSPYQAIEPIRQVPLVAWRLGLASWPVHPQFLVLKDVLGSCKALQQPIPKVRLMEVIGAAAAVPEGMSELVRLSKQIGIVIPKSQRESDLMRFFYLQKKIDSKMISELESSLDEIEAWLDDTMSQISDSLKTIDQNGASMFLLGIETQKCRYSADARKLWKTRAEYAEVPSSIGERFRSSSELNDEKTDWSIEVRQLNHEIKRWFRWGLQPI